MALRVHSCRFIGLVSLLGVLLCSCNVTKFVPEDEQLLKIYDTMTQAAALGDTDARIELYKQAEEEIWDAAYYIPCFFPVRSHVMAANLNIAGLRATGYMHVYEMSWN